MAKRQLHKLSALAVKNAKIPGLYGDGGGLLLCVTKGGTKNWIFRYKRHDMGLGAYPMITLEEARQRAADARKTLQQGVDPIKARLATPDTKKHISFTKACEAYIDAHSPAWRNAKHRQQWRNTLRDYAEPVIGKKDVRDIITDDCFRVLDPIWGDKHETASRLRGRMENIFDWCGAKGYRDQATINPAAWRGNLKHLLAARPKKSSARHHPAMPWRSVPAFIAELRGRDALAARALEFLILTCARTSEALLAERTEIEGDLWTVPGSRMKGGIEHRVALVPRALEIIEGLPIFEGNAFLFPGQRQARPLSNMAMEMALRRMGHDAITVHGFRSTFRDWAAEQTSFPSEIAEMCLAHLVGSEVERAYRRTDLLAKRSELLMAWADFCASGVRA